MYNFKRLIQLYSSDSLYVLKEEEGYYDDFNHWHKGDIEEVQIVGAVTNLNQDDLVFDDGGTYNQDDRKLYCYEELEKGSKVRHKELDYTILHDMDYTEHDEGLHIYYMKRGEQV